MKASKPKNIRMSIDFDPAFIKEVEKEIKAQQEGGYPYKRMPFLKHLAELGWLYYKKERDSKMK